MRKIMFGALVGAALMWFYDPANGAQRRTSLQRKLNRGQATVVVAPVHISDVGPDRSDTAAPSNRAAAR